MLEIRIVTVPIALLVLNRDLFCQSIQSTAVFLKTSFEDKCFAIRLLPVECFKVLSLYFS